MLNFSEVVHHLARMGISKSEFLVARGSDPTFPTDYLVDETNRTSFYYWESVEAWAKRYIASQ
ncbi:hypothetical protein ACTXJX_11900 [Glutamicibacter ardleyensis]|uniref:hypothetical protein n=1 Tax=Glutamicibacter ardleyensis TaxID=225894 RepID=UPI003FD12314